MRWLRRNELRTLTQLERVKHCGAHGVLPEGNVALSQAGDSWSFAGLSSCGSGWSCPWCSYKIAGARSSEITQAIEWCEREGGMTLLVTLSLQHRKGQPLRKLLKDGIQAGWREVTGGSGGGRAWREDQRVFGIQGWIRCVEVTYGENGWHPHVHALVLLDRQVSYESAEALGQRLWQRWDRGLRRNGLSSLRRSRSGDEVGVSVRRSGGAAEALGGYFAKSVWPNESLARETSFGLHGKVGKRPSSRSPFEILQSVLDTGDMADLELWTEYETATKGRHQLRWSNGLKSRVQVEEKTDEEIAEETIEGEHRLLLPAATWREIRNVGCFLLGTAREGGLAAAVQWLRRYGVDYELLPAGAVT